MVQLGQGAANPGTATMQLRPITKRSRFNRTMPRLVQLGLQLRTTGRTDDANAAYRQAIKINPDDAMAWNNLGFNYDKPGRTDGQL